MNIAVVDDLPEDRNHLLSNLEQYGSENALLLHLESYESGEEFFQRANPVMLDAVFLDIYMGGISGIEAAYRIKQLCPACQIIFITATPEFAIESYAVRAFHYILKPYRYENISDVMNLLDQNLQRSSRYIAVKEGRDWCKIRLSEILYVDQSNHYIQLHTEKSIVSTYMRFQEIEKKLMIYKEFLNCYRCVIVNMNQIEKVDEFFFLLRNGEYVPINRKRIKEIKGVYTDYIFGMIEDGGSGHH